VAAAVQGATTAASAWHEQKCPTKRRAWPGTKRESGRQQNGKKVGVSIYTYKMNNSMLSKLIKTKQSPRNMLKQFQPGNLQHSFGLTLINHLRPSSITTYSSHISQFCSHMMTIHKMKYMSQVTRWHIAEYLWFLASTDKKYNTITGATSAIKHIYKLDKDSPAHHPWIELTLNAIANVIGKRKTTKKPFSPAHFTTLYAQTDWQNMIQARNFCMSYFGFLGLLRANEIVNLRPNNVALEKIAYNGATVHCVILEFDKTKTKKETKGDVVVLGALPFRLQLDPYSIAIKYWKIAKKYKSEYFFVNTKDPKRALSANTVSHIVKHQMKTLGLDPKLYASHSLRVGGVTAAVKHGIPATLIQKHGRWQSTCWYGYFNDPTYAHLHTSLALNQIANLTGNTIDYSVILRK
jgi:site-specific recombinase XerD